MLQEKPFFPTQLGYLHREEQAENNSIKTKQGKKKGQNQLYPLWKHKIKIEEEKAAETAFNFWLPFCKSINSCKKCWEQQHSSTSSKEDNRFPLLPQLSLASMSVPMTGKGQWRDNLASISFWGYGSQQRGKSWPSQSRQQDGKGAQILRFLISPLGAGSWSSLQRQRSSASPAAPLPYRLKFYISRFNMAHLYLWIPRERFTI